jgi:hypothetical protein
MNNKKKIILLLIILIPITVTIISAIIIVLNIKEDNAVNQTDSNSTISYPSEEPTSSPTNSIQTEKSYQKLENYVSGGSSFYCPNHPKICQNIQNYYSNINYKNFTAAYEYGNKLRSYDNLVSTYNDYLIVSASYIKEQSDGSFIAYVTLVTKEKKIELYNVLITADENSILSSKPTFINDTLDVDCNYIDLSNAEVCVFKFSSNQQIANLIADGFFYRPQFYKGIELTDGNTIYYSLGSDALDKWGVIYKYNYKTKILTFFDLIQYKSFLDIENICTGDNDIDFGPDGCAEKYLTQEEIEKNKKYLEAIKVYKLNSPY